MEFGLCCFVGLVSKLDLSLGNSNLEVRDVPGDHKELSLREEFMD
jgi:hypothetical protein